MRSSHTISTYMRECRVADGLTMMIGQTIFGVSQEALSGNNEVPGVRFRPALVQYAGLLLFTEIDSKTVFYEIEDQDTGVTTVDLKLNYLVPAISGKIIARGRQIKLGKTLGYADVAVTTENGKLLAHGSSTLILLPGKGLSAEPPLPPKFV